MGYEDDYAMINGMAVIDHDDHMLDAAKEALTRPDDFGYFGREEMFDTWGMTLAQHRDSDTISRSNWEITLKLMTDKFGEAGEDNGWDVESYGHWAVGWIERLVVRVLEQEGEDTFGVTAVFKYTVELADQIDSYPVLDDEHHSALEHEEFVDYLRDDVGSNVEIDDIEFEPVGDDWAERLASVLYESHSATRPDDAPGWKEIHLIAIENGIFRADWKSVKSALGEIETERDNAVELAENAIEAGMDRDTRRLSDIARTLAEDYGSETSRRLTHTNGG